MLGFGALGSRLSAKVGAICSRGQHRGTGERATECSVSGMAQVASSSHVQAARRGAPGGAASRCLQGARQRSAGDAFHDREAPAPLGPRRDVAMARHRRRVPMSAQPTRGSHAPARRASWGGPAACRWARRTVDEMGFATVVRMYLPGVRDKSSKILSVGHDVQLLAGASEHLVLLYGRRLAPCCIRRLAKPARRHTDALPEPAARAALEPGRSWSHEAVAGGPRSRK
mmetsp:Transcript_91407/g.295696  ORF Transcript_91407/g.295696 Transcript_91407/m.295696 type:complete len:228 (-) Transcript_91407:2223-2906(-)